MNAVNAELSQGVGSALAEIDADASLRVAIIIGSGRAFCAGMDLKAFAAGEGVDAPEHPEWGFAGITRHMISKPVIVAVNGFAMGGGTEIVLAADLAIAARSASLGLPEVTRGLVAAAGGVLRLHRQVPKKVALEIALTGQPVGAERALELGLVNRVVDDAALLTEALALAEQIAANAPLAVRATKQLIHDSDRFGSDWDDEMWAHHAGVIAPIFASDDAAEGSRAFAEKRRPQWTGR